MKISENDIPKYIRLGAEKNAFEVLYKEVFPIVKRHIKKNNGNAEDANDVFQDALVLFYQQVMKNTFDPKYSVFGYVYRLSINRWINKIKRDKKMSLTDNFESEFEKIEYSDSYKETMQDEKKNKVIQQVFSQLGSKCEEILALTTYYDLSIEDIQHRLEMKSEGSVKMQIKRCREKLIELLRVKPELLQLIKR